MSYVINPNYRGEITVILHNISKILRRTSKSMSINSDIFHRSNIDRKNKFNNYWKGEGRFGCTDNWFKLLNFYLVLFKYILFYNIFFLFFQDHLRGGYVLWILVICEAKWCEKCRKQWSFQANWCVWKRPAMTRSYAKKRDPN